MKEGVNCNVVTSTGEKKTKCIEAEIEVKCPSQNAKC